MICSKNAAAWAKSDFLPLKISLELGEPKPINCYRRSLLLRELGGAGCLAWNCHWYLPGRWRGISGIHWGGARVFHRANVKTYLAMWGDTWLNTGKMMAVSPALVLKPHNSVFSCMSLAPPSCCPSARAQVKCLRASEFVCRPFKGTFAFPAAFHFTWVAGISTDFVRFYGDSSSHHWNSGPASPGLRLEPLAPPEKSPQPKYPSWHSTATSGYEIGPFYISGSPISLSVSSLYIFNYKTLFS